jgi:phosphatidyl-myo-inositol alpha-mannosyltransferase
MRVVLACPYDWDAPGGVQVHIRGLAEALSSKGHDVAIVTPSSRPTAEPDVLVVGRPVRIPYGGKVAPICASRASWRRVREALRVFEPDVVHVHEPFSPSTAMFAALSSPVPVAATFHAFHDRSRLLEIAAPVLRRVARRIDGPIAVSEAAAGFVADIVPGDVDVIGNGVDVGRFAGRSDRPAGIPEGRIMLWASRLDPQKGFRIAVRAFERLASRFDDLSFVVVGAGADAEAVDAVPRDVRDRIVMVGAVANRDLHPYHGIADVYVAPATGHESFGVILVEALAAGVPVVAADIPGYREVIRDDVDGLLVPPGDDRALAEGVARVLDDPALAERLAQAGRARAHAFSWDSVTPRIEAVYRRIAPAA